MNVILTVDESCVICTKVTRESFCYVACKYAKGEMPISLLGDSDSQLSPEDTLTFNNANWIKKVI